MFNLSELYLNKYAQWQSKLLDIRMKLVDKRRSWRNAFSQPLHCFLRHRFTANSTKINTEFVSVCVSPLILTVTQEHRYFCQCMIDRLFLA